ncbi:hypothetical protein [Celerinatantimonas sp. MCCC 1A17872]|uniref:hypothetical protein n=1 Tax=Celerinatantimonas sp. MCCC 1A17872 TaxID=3177514 RepID=UPI0038BEFE7E
MIKKINDEYVVSFWGVLNECCDFTEKRDLNLNNEVSIKEISENILIEAYIDLPYDIKIKTKDSLQYAINYWSDNKLERLYYCSIPMYSLPTNITVREFYIKVWNYIFNKDYYMD